MVTTMSFWVPETRLRLPQVKNNNKNKTTSEASDVSSDTVIHFYFISSSSIGELSALSKSEAMFVEQGECSQ